MAQVVVGGSREFNALAYGARHPGTVRYLEEQAYNASQMVDSAGRSFFRNAQELFQRFNGAEALRLAAAAVRKVAAIFQPNIIQPLWDMGGIQNAPPAMQRWIMAEPSVRELYHQQRCDGYSHFYEDMQPGRVGEQHYDWRRVNDGVVHDDEHGDARVTFYMDHIHEGDRELTITEKADIFSTWDFVKAYIKAGKEDPTSGFGAGL